MASNDLKSTLVQVMAWCWYQVSTNVDPDLCHQSHRTGQGQHPNLKLDMDMASQRNNELAFYQLIMLCQQLTGSFADIMCMKT